MSANTEREALRLRAAIHFCRTRLRVPGYVKTLDAILSGEQDDALLNPDFTLITQGAALATPPAQGVAQENLDHARQFLEAQGFQVFSTGPLPLPATPPAPSVPWEEQAARQCEEWAIVLTAKGSNAAKVFDRIQFNADAVKLRAHARAFRALLSKPAQEGTSNG